MVLSNVQHHVRHYLVRHIHSENVTYLGVNWDPEPVNPLLANTNTFLALYNRQVRYFTKLKKRITICKE